MRKLVAVLLGCLLLTACGASWEGKARFKITSLDTDSPPTEFFVLELVGSAPKGVLEAADLDREFIHTSEVSGGAAVGDEITCTVRQERGSAVGNAHVKSYLSECEKV